MSDLRAVEHAETDQMELDLRPRMKPGHQRPAIERLRAVLRRSGIDWGYRSLRGSVLLRPMLGVAFGWQPMCGYYSCGDITFERSGYFDRPRLNRQEREEVQAYLCQRRECIYELWGKP